MGHAGAIISGSSGTAAEKLDAFKAAGIGIAKRPKDFVELLQAIMKSPKRTTKPVTKRAAAKPRPTRKPAKKKAKKR